MPVPDDQASAQLFREQAARCRRLAEAITDAIVIRRLLDLAIELEQRADAEEAGESEC